MMLRITKKIGDRGVKNTAQTNSYNAFSVNAYCITSSPRSHRENESLWRLDSKAAFVRRFLNSIISFLLITELIYKDFKENSRKLGYQAAIV